MKYMDIGCTVNCWECTRECELKSIMQHSISNPIFERLFYEAVMDALKAQAGLLITRGLNPTDVNEDVKILAVSFYVARLKVAETLQKY